MRFRGRKCDRPRGDFQARSAEIRVKPDKKAPRRNLTELGERNFNRAKIMLRLSKNLALFAAQMKVINSRGDSPKVETPHSFNKLSPDPPIFPSIFHLRTTVARNFR